MGWALIPHLGPSIMFKWWDAMNFMQHRLTFYVHRQKVRSDFC
jgi:hypothetical protein